MIVDLTFCTIIIANNKTNMCITQNYNYIKKNTNR